MSKTEALRGELVIVRQWWRGETRDVVLDAAIALCETIDAAMREPWMTDREYRELAMAAEMMVACVKADEVLSREYALRLVDFLIQRCEPNACQEVIAGRVLMATGQPLSYPAKHLGAS